MITVSIFINGNPLYTRSARNTGNEDDTGCTEYITDTGEYLYHDRDDGAVELARKMLDTIKEDGLK